MNLIFLTTGACVWGEWGAWSDCTDCDGCDKGNRRRQRYIE